MGRGGYSSVAIKEEQVRSRAQKKKIHDMMKIGKKELSQEKAKPWNTLG